MFLHIWGYSTRDKPECIWACLCLCVSTGWGGSQQCHCSLCSLWVFALCGDHHTITHSRHCSWCWCICVGLYSICAGGESAGPSADGDKKKDEDAAKVKNSHMHIQYIAHNCTSALKVIVVFCHYQPRLQSLKQPELQLVCVLLWLFHKSDTMKEWKSVIFVIVILFPIQQGEQTHSLMLLRRATWVMMREKEAMSRIRRRRSWRRRR